MRLGMQWPYVSCKTLDKNERALLGICTLAGSYRWQSPVIMKTVFSKCWNGSDFRALEAVNYISCGLCSISSQSFPLLCIFAPGLCVYCWAWVAWPPCQASVHILLSGAVGDLLGYCAWLTETLVWYHVLAVFLCCVCFIRETCSASFAKNQ